MKKENDYSGELTNAEYAAVGRFVRACAQVENLLLIAAGAILDGSGSDFDPEKRKKRAESAVTGAFGTRASYFFETYEGRYGRDAWSDTLRAELDEIRRWRDTVCHGICETDYEGELIFFFLDRKSLKHGLFPSRQRLTFRALLFMTEKALVKCKELDELINKSSLRTSG